MFSCFLTIVILSKFGWSSKISMHSYMKQWVPQKSGHWNILKIIGPAKVQPAVQVHMASIQTQLTQLTQLTKKTVYIGHIAFKL